MVKGRCEINVVGILYYYFIGIKNRALIRHAKNILNHNKRNINYGNAEQLSKATGIPMDHIIV